MPTNDAVTKAFDEHWAFLVRLTFGWTRHWQDAEDVVQTAFARVTLRPNAVLERPYLVNTCRWVWANVRRARLAERRSLAHVHSLDVEVDLWGGEVPGLETLPLEAQVESRDAVTAVGEGLTMLTPLQRQYVLRVAGGWISRDQVTGAVREGVYRGRRVLQAYLQDRGHDVSPTRSTVDNLKWRRVS